MDTALLMKEINSLGYTVSRCDSSGGTDADAPKEILQLIISAHGKPPDSTEAQSLRLAVGEALGEKAWDEYVKVRVESEIREKLSDNMFKVVHALAMLLMSARQDETSFHVDPKLLDETQKALREILGER